MRGRWTQGPGYRFAHPGYACCETSTDESPMASHTLLVRSWLLSKAPAIIISSKPTKRLQHNEHGPDRNKG